MLDPLYSYFGAQIEATNREMRGVPLQHCRNWSTWIAHFGRQYLSLVDVYLFSKYYIYIYPYIQILSSMSHQQTGSRSLCRSRFPFKRMNLLTYYTVPQKKFCRNHFGSVPSITTCMSWPARFNWGAGNKYFVRSNSGMFSVAGLHGLV